MRYQIILALLVAPFFAQSQSLQDEINEQVWGPFIEAFNNRDNVGFKAVHSQEVIRVIRDGNQILGADEYFKPPNQSWNPWERKLELRFTERIANEDKAFEVGYYKNTSTNKETGEQRISYGKFHVLLRKEDGQWKILMDADGREDASSETFEKADPMEQ